MLNDIIARKYLSLSIATQKVESNDNGNAYFIDKIEESERNNLGSNYGTQEEGLCISCVNP